MSNLSHEARALLELDRQFGGPSPEDQARVRTAVMIRLATAAAGASLALGTANVVTSKSAGTAASAGLLKVWLTSGTIKIVSALLVGAVAGSATTTAYHRRAATKRELSMPASVTSAHGEARSISPPSPGPNVVVPDAPQPSGQAHEQSLMAAPLSPPSSWSSRPPRSSPSPVREATAVSSAEPSVPLPSSVRHDTIERELLLLDLSQRALRHQDLLGALDALERHAREFPQGTLAEERDAARIVTLCALGRGPEGRRLAHSFLLARPLSPLAPRVQAACAGR